MGIIWGQSERMLQIRAEAERICSTRATVLLTGPTGSGKEVVARFIHDSSKCDGPFLAINCAALPENLLESLLFGHERGVFTGAFDRHIGLLERAAGGTVFLDEIGCLNATLQAKFLRVLQEMEFHRLGSHVSIRLNARVIAATNEQLDVAMREGRFREDLYYRLAVFPISIPSLKARLEDIPVFFHAFLENAIRRYDLRPLKVNRSMVAALKTYAWPGNIRELQGAVESGVLRCKGDTFGFEELPETIRKHISGTSEHVAAAETMGSSVVPMDCGWISQNLEIPHGGLRELLAKFEKAVITDILKRHGGILNRAYKELGIPKPTLIQRTRRLNIDVNRIKYEASL